MNEQFATQTEAYYEHVRNLGIDNPDQCWILTQFDTWERNPSYTGPDQPHPESPADNKPLNSYRLFSNSTGDLDIIYITPCGDAIKVAYIPAAECSAANPAVVWINPIIGVRGLVKIAALLEEYCSII